MRTIRTLRFALALTAACSYAGTASAAKVCDKPALSGYGSDSQKGQAKSAAKSDWSSKAYAIAPAYSSWSKARNSSISCVAEGKWPNRYWRCTATAEPCRKK